MRNLAALPLATLLALALTVSPAQAGGSSGASGTMVADGFVTGAGGAPMAGVAIDLYAWPSDAVLADMKDGQSVPTTLLASATTSTTGEYQLQVPAAQLKAAAVESGYANLEISGAGGGIWFFSYQTSSLPAHPSSPLTINLPRRKRLCGKGPDGVYPNTGWVKVHQRKAASAVVGQGYIVPEKKTAGDNMRFEYNQTTNKDQSTALGVGISGYGVDAGYNTSGHSTSTASASESYPAQHKNTWFRTQFGVGQFRAECYDFTGKKVRHLKQHGQCPREYKNKDGVFYVHKCLWLVRSTGWNSGATWSHPKVIPDARYCAKQFAGTVFNTSNATAIEWAHGWNIGASVDIKGVNLKGSYSTTAQTGYDRNAVMHFAFHHLGWMCGTNHEPPKAAQLVMRGSS
jgi:hypothetical protein